MSLWLIKVLLIVFIIHGMILLVLNVKNKNGYCLAGTSF